MKKSNGPANTVQETSRPGYAAEDWGSCPKLNRSKDLVCLAQHSRVEKDKLGDHHWRLLHAIGMHPVVPILDEFVTGPAQLLVMSGDLCQRPNLLQSLLEPMNLWVHNLFHHLILTSHLQHEVVVGQSEAAVCLGLCPSSQVGQRYGMDSRLAV